MVSFPGDGARSVSQRNPDNTMAVATGITHDADYATEREDNEVAGVLADLAPWAASILLHAGLVILALCLVWVSISDRVPDEHVIVPTLIHKPNAKPTLVMNDHQSTKPSSSKRRTVNKTQRKPSQIVSKMKLPTKLIGIRGGPTAKASPLGMGVGNRGVFGDGIYGSPMGNARKVVYLVDASGSLIDTFPFVLAELRRSIGELHEKQSFTVIFFQGDSVIESTPAGLKRADLPNKQRVIHWLSPDGGAVTPMGQSNPIPALKRALRYRPDLVFLLSDNITGEGQYEVNQKALLAEVRRANVAGTKINTLQYLYPDPLTRIGLRGTMDLIAAESAGVATFVSAADLAIE